MFKYSYIYKYITEIIYLLQFWLHFLYTYQDPIGLILCTDKGMHV